ncbi:unnamed protein product [Candida verbasci]|uniref:non-specific serine/threonine protein kinase n=1 Tax=Candida verbasci TaxID=1227364 RepID=A0A9W4TVZ4_9ASCO|nr:unnamed protein product [Candida verbasci]
MSENIHQRSSSIPPSFYIQQDNDNNNHNNNNKHPTPPSTSSSLNPKRQRFQKKSPPELSIKPINDSSSSLFAPSTLPTKSLNNQQQERQQQLYINEFDDILKFPIESSHAYSYAHLSPNSLALRLNVLKRSLEILKDRPELFKSINLENEENIETQDTIYRSISNPINDLEMPLQPRPNYLYSQTNHSSDYLLDTSPTTNNLKNKKYKLQSNASSAALAALFKPQLKRSDSLPLDEQQNIQLSKISVPSTLSKSTTTKNQNDFKDIINLLENDLDSLMDNSEIASTLHDLSLNKNKSDSKWRQDIVKHKLLYALAMPFMETSILTSSLLGNDLDSSTRIRPSTVSLNLLNSPITPTTSLSNQNRPFHAMTKNSLPQSVFTVDADFPWSVKAANDLACLMFGVSKSTIKALTLMDLVAPQFREFVLKRLTNINLRKDNNKIIFAGEIIAIVKGDSRSDQTFASIFASLYGKTLVIMFDQIPCDAFDVRISSDQNSSEYIIESINENAGDLIDTLPKLHKLSDLSESLSKELNEESDESINETRYYTIQLYDKNIPCAITSDILDNDEDQIELLLKIHCMPYIAGIFVINSKSYQILSCNNAIAKNLFGKSIDQLHHKSINEIIPNFTKILNAGLEDNIDRIDVVPGLVLPEHFFRKYDSVLKKLDNLEQYQNVTEESIFFNSCGIQGLHRDGKIIYVDVQLRASSHDTLIIWITYSRNNRENKFSKDLEELSNSSTSSLSLNKRHTKNNSSNKIEDNLKHERTSTNNSIVPSQSKLFDNNKENDLLEFSPREITRASSTRRVKTNSSFMVPLEKVSSYNYDKDSINTSGILENEEKIGNDTGFSISNTYPEDDILKLENDSLEKLKNESKKWPKEVGLIRRNKQFSEFKVLKEMGEGAYGKVVLAQHKEDPLYKIIIKCIDKERILVDTWVRDRKLGTIPSEIQIMAFLNSEPHPNIMRIIDFFEDSKYYYLETPIFGNPPAIDLFDFIEVKKDLGEYECKFIFKQIVSAIYHLHKQGIVHRDIKDENIIVDEKGIIKLIDFGSAGYVKQGPFDVFVGTIDYASPEVLKGEKYHGKPQDIWALGILLYTMLYKENPFYNVDEIMEGDLRIPYIVSDQSINLIKRILNRNVDCRPTIADIVEHEWLNT